MVASGHAPVQHGPHRNLAREPAAAMFTTPIVPRVSETDGAGHINNTVTPVWL